MMEEPSNAEQSSSTAGKEIENPLLAALPPATDYLTYLTLIEYNLTKENLPVLHEVLQDSKLTINIGWDLVHLLLPFLPDSEPCLQDIARLGNPREVILKVTEALRLLDFDIVDDLEEKEAPSDDESTAQVQNSPQVRAQANANIEGGVGDSNTEAKLPLPVIQFESLLSLLSTLHSRIATKYPSRFLSTSLQAVLASYNDTEAYPNERTEAVLKFVKTLSGTKRPHLPPRISSSQLLTVAQAKTSASDPEAQNEPPSKDESSLYQRLLQSFVTHVLEDFMLSLPSVQNVPGLAWSNRLLEKLHPERNIPGKPTLTQTFAKDIRLKDRSLMVGQIVALARDIKIDSKDLLASIMDPQEELSGRPNKEDDPPESPQDIPYSKTGALFLLVAREVAEVLYDTPKADLEFQIFPQHADIVQNFIGNHTSGEIGLEPDALLDAVLALGVCTYEKNQIGSPADDEQFNKYIQTTSVMSANTPSPTLRFHAHYLTSKILHSNPSDVVRLAYIRDTLEHCPYANLKESAVGWLKDEIVQANLTSAKPGADAESKDNAAASSAEDSTAYSIFATPVTLSMVAPFLFPDLTQDLLNDPIQDAYSHFVSNFSFYLATLNFCYLLLQASTLHDALDVKGFNDGSGIPTAYLEGLRKTVSRFMEALKDGGELAEGLSKDERQHIVLDISLMLDALDRVDKGLETL